jgi:hypothetical protein
MIFLFYSDLLTYTLKISSLLEQKAAMFLIKLQ